MTPTTRTITDKLWSWTSGFFAVFDLVVWIAVIIVVGSTVCYYIGGALLYLLLSVLAVLGCLVHWLCAPLLDWTGLLGLMGTSEGAMMGYAVIAILSLCLCVLAICGIVVLRAEAYRRSGLS